MKVLIILLSIYTAHSECEIKVENYANASFIIGHYGNSYDQFMNDPEIRDVARYSNKIDFEWYDEHVQMSFEYPKVGVKPSYNTTYTQLFYFIRDGIGYDIIQGRVQQCPAKQLIQYSK